MTDLSTFRHRHLSTDLKGLARIIVGFLVFRHGMEQAIGYPKVSDADLMSLRGFLELLSFPGGLLIMLGLFVRPVALVLSSAYLIFWLVGPLRESLMLDRTLFGSRGPSDPVLLSGFFFLYLVATGAGAWSLDRLRRSARDVAEAWWAPHALSVLRIVAAFLFVHHGVQKFFGENVADPLSLRTVAGVLEIVGGPLLLVGLFTRPLAFLFSGEMAFAYFLNHAPEGFWPSFEEPNQEAAILNCFLFLFLSGEGPGAWSLDRVLERRRESRDSLDPRLSRVV